MVSFIDEDEEFTKEIIGLFIKNLIEFRHSLAEAIEQEEPSIYLKAHHKIKTTLGYVNNEQLNDAILRVLFLLKERGMKGIDNNIQNAFCGSCTSAIKSLENDLEKIKQR